MASRPDGEEEQGKEQVVEGEEVVGDCGDGIVEAMVKQAGAELSAGRLVEPADEVFSDVNEHERTVDDEVCGSNGSDGREETISETVVTGVEDDKNAVFETTVLTTVEHSATMLSEENIATKVPVIDEGHELVEQMETEEVEMKIEPVEQSGDANMATENTGTCNEIIPMDQSDIKDEKTDIPHVTIQEFTEDNVTLEQIAHQEQSSQQEAPQKQLYLSNRAQDGQSSHQQAPQEQLLTHHQASKQTLSHHQTPSDQSSFHHQSPQEQPNVHPQVTQEQSITHYQVHQQQPSHHKAPQQKPSSHYKAPHEHPVSHHQDLSHRLSPRSEMEARKLSLEMAPLLPPTSVIVSTQMLSMNSSSIMSIPSSTPVSLLPGTITSMPSSSLGRVSASYPNIPTISIPDHPVTSHPSSLPQLVYTSSQLIIPQPSLSQSSQIHLVTPSHAEVVKMLQPTSPTIPKAPKTDLLLQTAMKVLQLPSEDEHQVLHNPQKSIHNLNMLPVSETVISSNESVIPDQIISNGGMEQSIGVEEEVQQMEVGDENTYILEPVNSDEFYDDPNIMWIQETVEVEQESYDNLPNMVIILNPNGTVNEELMLANGMNAQDVEAVKEAVLESMPNMVPATTASPPQLEYISSPPPQQNLPISITHLQEPIPRRLLVGIQPIMPPRTIVQSSVPLAENSRSVILDAKDDFLVLDDIARDPMIEPIDSALPVLKQGHPSRPVPELKRIPGNYQVGPGQHGQPGRTFQMAGGGVMQGNAMGGVLQGNAMPLPITELGTLDLSLPKKDVQSFKPDPAVLEQYVDPSALVSENTVLRALAAKAEAAFLPNKGEYASKSVPPKVARLNPKVRRQKPKDENANSPYIARKTNSLGALGNALHGSPGLKDARENAVQICPICKFQATTKNPYRHLQDHLARCHFKERIAADLPTRKPYICPMPGCDQKSYPDWQAVMRHYIGKKHGILDKFVKEELGNIRRDDPRYKLHLRAGDLGILPRSDPAILRPPDHAILRPPDHHPQIIRSSASDLVQQQRGPTKPVVAQQQVVQIHI